MADAHQAESYTNTRMGVGAHGVYGQTLWRPNLSSEAGRRDSPPAARLRMSRPSDTSGTRLWACLLEHPPWAGRSSAHEQAPVPAATSRMLSVARPATRIANYTRRRHCRPTGRALSSCRRRSIAVGTPITGRPTNSDPSGCGAAACVAEDRDVVAEGRECTTIGRHGVVVEEAAHDLPQPLPLLGDRLVHAPPQFFLHLPQLRRHAVTPGLPLELKVAPAVLAADEGEAQEVEGSRLAQPALLSIGPCVAAELDQAGLLRMQRQRELLKPCAHHVEEPTSVSLVLEPGHNVVGIAHDDHVAGRLALSPAVGPEVEGVVQVDVGKQRRDHRPLPRPPVTDVVQ